MHFLLPLLLFLSLSEPGLAETRYPISGIVVDSETGETLPSATVLIGDGLSGTITSREGEFSFTAEVLPVSITVRYIGYNSVTMELDEESEFPVRIELTPSRTELDEVVVTDRDPGLSIMELVIERKKLWREDLNNYRVDAYTRQTIASDTSIVSITESQSEAYWDRRYGHREVQRSRRQTSNLGADQNFAGVRYLPNFYDDNIEIAGYRMVGITHPDALRYYRFRLLETTQMDGVPVYKIGVEPRRERQPLFEGVAWVLGREYALLEVNLKPNDVVNFPPPVQEFDLSYMQQFSNYGGDFWLPVDVRIEGKIRIAMVGLRFPAINFRQISRLSGYELNTEIPDSVFRDSPLLVRLDSVPGAPPTELEELDGSVPLTADERRAYATIDSTRTLEEAFRPEGFLARMIERQDERTGSQGFGANLSGISPRAGFNRVDGYQLGANYNRRFRDIGLRVDGYAGYNFFGKEWDTGVEIGQRILTGGGRSLSIFGGYHRATDTQYRSEYVGRFMNSTVTLLGGDDYFDYFRNERIETGLRVRNLVPRSLLTISVRRELHRTHNREGIYDHSLFGWHTERRVNPEIEEGELRSLDFRLALNEQPGISGFAGSRSAILSVEWSSPDLGSEFDFLRAEGTVTWNIETFYTRRLFANTLDLIFSAGASTGDLPIQRSLSVDGSLSAFGPFGSIKTRRGVPYTGTEYWLAYAEHNFRTIPFELIGLNPLVERGWGIILFGGAAQASGVMPGGGYTSGSVHSEVGVSLNSVFGVLRLDFAKRLDAPGSFIGLSVPRYF
ncbi:MAG: carboxypeptidase-like regulatory domain-containing protein [Balneolaceae bacterium]|nr:carboxypeptidase-like regulatory domain-containing protein [Balneolaceae bacterium]MCH8548091.1 DUF5686 and carboxypeptidase regulatory-like domain-containing protein [Balneolaceae bacterium]